MNNAEKPDFEYLVKEINQYFNFEKVHKAMIATEWHWNFGQDSYGQDRDGIPTLSTIKNYAYHLLKQAYDEDLSRVCSGGFSAGWDNGELYLTFTLEETSVG